MKILTAAQIREADSYTIKHEPIASIDLMERAANSCANWVFQNCDKQKTFLIFCGLGNNGGDGLAIGRLLLEKNYAVRIYVFRYADKCSADFKKNETRLLNNKTKLIDVNENNFRRVLKSIPPEVVIIDALFGSGLTKPIDGWLAKAIHILNASNKEVIAIDIPSGMFCENNTNENLATIVKANSTLTFQTPKLSFMLASCGTHVGKFYILDIGLNKEHISQADSNYHYFEKDDIKHLIKKRVKFSHKGSYGHALLIAGSYGKMGAAVLAAKSCLRSGAGLLTVRIPQCGYEIIQSSVPEAMASVDKSKNYIAHDVSLNDYSSIGIGPGLDKNKESQKFLKRLLENVSAPLILDADALNILGENKNWLTKLPASSILTPHPKEFERFTKKVSSDIERLELQRSFAIQHKIYLVLKSAHTSIACPDGKIFFNSTGNPGMATGGSGDVLTGIITSLLAQDYTPFDSCMIGVFIHGLAGDLALKTQSSESMIASDIIEHLGPAFNMIKLFE